MKMFIIAMVAVVAVAASAVAGDIALPEPQKSGGPDLQTAINERHSASNAVFPSGDLSNDDLATILWAATGKNRDGSKWTVPMAMGRPPYCKVYITNESGVYFYDWTSHVLKQVSEEQVHGLIPQQSFAKSVPVNLYIVTDAKGLAEFRGQMAAELGPLLAGMMAQNVYLACQTVNVGARLIYSIDRGLAAEYFELPEGDVALFAICLGKK